MIDLALIHDARQATTGANVHVMAGLIAMYRSLAEIPGHEAEAKQFEDALRQEIAKVQRTKR